MKANKENKQPESQNALKKPENKQNNIINPS
jgi:hypothetical protein